MSMCLLISQPLRSNPSGPMRCVLCQKAALLLISVLLSSYRSSAAIPIRTTLPKTPLISPWATLSSWLPQHKVNPRVWRITRYSSLLGPTLAIFLYSQMSRTYCKYRPYLSIKAKQIMKEVRESYEGGWTRERPVAFDGGSVGGESWLAVAVANDAIRVLNRGLRERAVVSRIQMDDDALEFRRSLSKRELREMAREVIDSILREGSGTLLEERDKSVVRRLVMRAIH